MHINEAKSKEENTLTNVQSSTLMQQKCQEVNTGVSTHLDILHV